eukprot:TRINITY_DN1198_c0_g1_i1.p1 TRINITY_DN1198_c0_g1~~TRINITY_DN1198_c0_g1_i1.p1  ORF type:complete len:317 (-),score=83.26 TRINITY_DN1198_c0_g1_i1:355-1305(-)
MSASGTVKSFNSQKGFGFVDCGTGNDVYVHIKDCVDGNQPAPGDVLTFDLEPSQARQGQMQAKNVRGGSANKTQPGGGGVAPMSAMQVQGTGAYTGRVRTWNEGKGYGFIEHEGGPDIWVHVKECVGSQPAQGDFVRFDIEPSPTKPGQNIAKNVTGGSRPIGEGKPQGSGGGGFGPMRGGATAMPGMAAGLSAGPYGVATMMPASDPYGAAAQAAAYGQMYGQTAVAMPVIYAQPGIYAQPAAAVDMSQYGAVQMQPGMTMQQPGMTMQQPGMTMQQPGMTMQQPDMGAMQQPGMGMPQPGMVMQPPAMAPPPAQ